MQAAGEEAVRKAFPGATIFRPGVLVGIEDRMFNSWARLAMNLPFLPLTGGDACVQVCHCWRQLQSAMFTVRSWLRLQQEPYAKRTSLDNRVSK